MRFIPKRLTLSEIVAGHGGLKDYLDDPEQVALHNGKDYHDIMLLLDESVAAAARQTKRNPKHIYKIRAIREKEAAAANDNQPLR